MAKKKKEGFGFPKPEEVRGVIWKMPMSPEMRVLYGIGAFVFGAAAIRIAPKAAQHVIPILLSAFTPPPGYIPFSSHPEARENIETLIDERQLGRSEVIREIAKPKNN